MKIEITSFHSNPLIYCLNRILFSGFRKNITWVIDSSICWKCDLLDIKERRSHLNWKIILMTCSNFNWFLNLPVNHAVFFSFTSLLNGIYYLNYISFIMHQLEYQKKILLRSSCIILIQSNQIIKCNYFLIFARCEEFLFFFTYLVQKFS